MLSAQDEADPQRQLLQWQLGLAWRFGNEVVFPQIDHERCLWEPSGNVATVRHGTDGWVADWPDEEHPPLPEVTIGWLLWHIEWWWSNTARAVRSEDLVPAREHHWSGSIEGTLDCKAVWDEVLASTALDRQITGLMPKPEPLGIVAAWVNFELTKNLSEMNQRLMGYANIPSRATMPDDEDP